MGIFDWVGPLNVGGKRAPYDFGPLLETRNPKLETGSVATEQRSLPLSLPNAALTVNTVVYGAGAARYGGAEAPSNSAVFACLQSIATAVAEPELKLYDTSAGQRVEVDDSDLGRLFARPNPHMSLDTLLAYVAVCLHVAGNAYWRKLRAGDPERGNVVELWPISPFTIEPYTEPGSDDFISYYKYYTTRGEYKPLPTQNVVHFRYELDDRDHRYGTAPLSRLLREISSDEQATRYADRLLANLAINGLTLSFDKESAPIDQATADELKARVQSAYGGDNVGAVSVLAPGATLTALGFSPEQMDLQVLHRVPEERISAVLGVPAIVAGLGAGLDRSTYSNFREAREAFTETKLLPLWAQLAATLTTQLLPDFTSDAGIVVDFDTSEVRALADDQNALALRLKTLVEAGILSTDEARAEIGYDPMATQPVSISRATSRGASGLGNLLRTVPVTSARGFLPDTRSPLEPDWTKALEDIPPTFAAHKLEVGPEWLVEFERWLVGVRRRVLRRLNAGGDTAADLVPEIEAEILAAVERPLHEALLSDVADVVRAELSVAFQLDDAATRQYLQSAGANIGGITETTRTAVQDALVEGQMAGEGIDALARRLRALPAFDQARARLVARTELGHAQNTAALTSYRGSGVVVGIRVLDGDYDAACAAINGRTFTLDQAPATLQHPNCTRAFAPLTDAAELTASA